MKVHIYVDDDNNNVYVFTSLEKAKAFAEEEWGTCDWEECATHQGKNWFACDYVHIYEREIK